MGRNDLAAEKLHSEPAVRADENGKSRKLREKERRLAEKERRKQRKKKILLERSRAIHIRTAFAFVGVLVIVTAGNILSQDKTYSEMENKMLAQKPEFSAAQFSSGQFMQDMEAYTADQFVFRNQWINMKLMMDMALGKKESNGVYIGKKRYLLEIPEAPDQVQLDRNLDAIRDFAARQSDVHTVMTLVPNAAYICDQIKPANAPVRDQAADIEYVKNKVGSALNYVNLVDTMSAHKEEPIYYKTDHHWTTLGARYAFEALAQPLNIQNPTQEYDVYPVTHNFSGTLSAKSGYNRATDTIDIYVPKNVSTECIVNYTDNNVKSASLYNSEALEKRDKYEVFLGGNYGRVDIETPMEEKRNLLLIKDSYANCFIPFLVPYYRNITIIDPRYFSGDMESLMAERQITDILILYNVNTFLGDNSLADVLAN